MADEPRRLVGSGIKQLVERLLAQDADPGAQHQLLVVFFFYGDRGMAQQRLEEAGFEHRLSTYNEEGWSSVDGEWVMHVRRVQPVTEDALRQVEALLKSICVVTDISFQVPPEPK